MCVNLFICLDLFCLFAAVVFVLFYGGGGAAARGFTKKMTLFEKASGGTVPLATLITGSSEKCYYSLYMTGVWGL